MGCAILIAGCTGLSGVPDAARKAILEQYSKLKQANGWMVSTASGHYGTDYLSRALVVYIGVGGNLPEDAFYPIARFDGDGKMLNGGSRYVLHSRKRIFRRLIHGDSGPSRCTTANIFWSQTP